MYGRLEIGDPRGGLLLLGVGEVCELGGNVVELLPEVLVFLGNGCDHLGYPAQLMRAGHQALDELGEENYRDRFHGEGAGLRIWAEVGEVLVAEPESASRLSELPHHELDGVVG